MSELTSSWILTYFVHGSALIAALWILDRTAILRDPMLRERLWRAALIVPFVSATLQVAAPGLALTDPVPVEQSRLTLAPVASSEPAEPAPRQRMESAKPASPEAGPAMIDFDPYQVLGWLWLVAGTWLLSRVVVSTVRGRRMLRNRRPVTNSHAAAELDSLVRTVGVEPVRLSVSTAVPGPLTLPGREICLPVRALSLPVEELRGMLAHELAHVVRGDAMQRLGTTVLCAIFCIQPLNFVVRRRLVECAELNADDWASRLTGEGRSLARCLVKVATWLEPSRAPAYAVAMAESDRGLLARVRRLADGNPDSRGWRGRGSIIGLLVLATLVVPGIVLTSNDGDASPRIVDGDGTFSVSSTDDDGTLRVRATGDVRFTEDERGIAYLDPGKELRIESRDRRADGRLHELRVRAAADGTLAYEYEVDGEERPFDRAGREWLAGILPRLFRTTGIQAAERVARIHGRGGVDAVLDEIEMIPSDFVARLYFVELAGRAGVTADERVRIYRLAGESIGSDFELRHTLEAFPLGADSTPGEARALLIAAREIGSDFEAAELLASVAGDLPNDGDTIRAFVETASGIGSDFELSRTLKATVGADWAKGHSMGDLLELSGEIGSDFEQAGFLIDAVPRVAGDAELQRRYLEVAAGVGSDFELSRVLQVFLRIDGLDAVTVGRALDTAIAEIGSDHELLQVLKAAAPAVRRNPYLHGKYEKAAESLSDHEFREAMRAL